MPSMSAKLSQFDLLQYRGPGCESIASAAHAILNQTDTLR